VFGRIFAPGFPERQARTRSLSTPALSTSRACFEATETVTVNMPSLAEAQQMVCFPCVTLYNQDFPSL